MPVKNGLEEKFAGSCGDWSGPGSSTGRSLISLGSGDAYPIKDFAAVAPLGNLPLVLVIAPSKNIKTVQELVALGKKRPITFGSIGVGSPIHLAMERLRLSAGFQEQAIPFKGAVGSPGTELEFAL